MGASRGWEATLRFRASGFKKLSMRCHEINDDKRGFWRLKAELPDLLLEDLGPVLPQLFPDERQKVRQELVEVLKEEFALRVFLWDLNWPMRRALMPALNFCWLR